MAACDYEPRASNFDLYKIRYKSKNHARSRANSTGIENDSRRL
jgi:hypothetical protein